MSTFPRTPAGAFVTRARSQRASEIDPMEWLFDLLISNDAAALFIAIVGVSVLAITWRLYRQD